MQVTPLIWISRIILRILLIFLVIFVIKNPIPPKVEKFPLFISRNFIKRNKSIYTGDERDKSRFYVMFRAAMRRASIKKLFIVHWKNKPFLSRSGFSVLIHFIHFAKNHGRDFASLNYTVLRFPQFLTPNSEKILRALGTFSVSFVVKKQIPNPKSQYPNPKKKLTANS